MPKSLARDAVVLILCGALWWLNLAWAAAAEGAPAALLRVLAGVAVFPVSYLAHEYGHLAGALLSRSVVHFPESLAVPFVFRYDVERNGRAQFLAMSLGGFAATAVVIALLVALCDPRTLHGGIALALVGLGVIAAVVTEAPVFWRVARGGPLPRGSAYSGAGGAVAS